MRPCEIVNARVHNLDTCCKYLRLPATYAGNDVIPLHLSLTCLGMRLPPAQVAGDAVFCAGVCWGEMARLAGIEPTTLGFGGRYSIH